MKRLRLQLMHREALKRIADADTLASARAFGECTDSAHILRLLGLELLLKLVYEIKLNRRPIYSHKYHLIFADLPSELQTRIASLVGERIGPSSFSENYAAILREWGDNFITLRYPYEKYETLDLQGYDELGGKWIEDGAPLDQATFRFYPEELIGLIYALRVITDELVSTLDS